MVLMNFHLLVHVTSWKNCEKVYFFMSLHAYIKDLRQKKNDGNGLTLIIVTQA